jgi:hypothetical protein
MRQRDAGHEEIAGRANYCTNPETGATGSNGTVAREGNRSPGIGRRSQDTNSTDPSKSVWN